MSGWMKWVALFVVAMGAGFTTLRPAIQQWIEDELGGKW